MKTVLITGADGFAGGALLEHLRQQGYSVVAGVRNRARKLAYEQRLIKSLVCEVGDAINVARVVAAVKPDWIVHLAGTSRPAAANAEPLTAYQSVVSAWANVLDAARRAVPRARILMVSACDVYGNLGTLDQPLRETDGPAAITTFGSLKVTAEQVARTFFKNYHLDIMIARPFHHTGPGQSNQFFFGAAAQRIAEWNALHDGMELALPDLDCRRDLTHVKDVAEAYEALLTNGRPNEIYNVCSGVAPSCRELIQAMVRSGGQNITLVDQPPVADDTQRVQVLWGDNSKICGETGWQPTRSPENTVVELVRHAKQVASAPA